MYPYCRNGFAGFGVAVCRDIMTPDGEVLVMLFNAKQRCTYNCNASFWQVVLAGIH